MPRTARMLVDGGTYHVLTRGNNGQTVFHEDADSQRYLQLLASALREHGLCLHHFVLMPNHVHLVIRIPNGQALSTAMHRVNLTYGWYYRKRRRYTGHLWQGRFKSFLINRDAYLLECGRYVELNPVRAGIVQHPHAYAWSSYRAYAEGKDSHLITPNPLYETFGATERERQERYRQFMQEGLRASQASAVHPSRQPAAMSLRELRHMEERFGMPATRGRRGRPKHQMALTSKKKNNTSP